MVRISLTILILFSNTILAYSQSSKSIGYLSQWLDINGYTGKDIRLKVKTKGQEYDTACKVTLLISFIGKNNKTLQSVSEVNPIPIGENWQEHVIDVKVPKLSKFANVAVQFVNKGIYYFDDFQMNLLNNGGIDSSVNLLKNPSFENDSIPSVWSLQLSPWFKGSFSKEVFYTGKTSMRVDGRVFRKILVYGKNDTAGHFVNVNNNKLYYEVYGNGEPLILLHGNGQSIGSFSQQIYGLSQFYKVIAIDTRGHGQSTEDGTQYSYQLFAEDLKVIIDTLKLDKLIIVGWSDGANTGLIFALRYPEKVKTLVSMGANIFIDNTVVSKGTFRMLRKGIRYFENDTSYSARNKVRLCQLLLTEPKLSFEDISRIQCPVLVMAGQNDIINEAHTRAIAAAIPKSTLYIVPKETHFLPMENGKLFNQIILSYLKNGTVIL